MRPAARLALIDDLIIRCANSASLPALVLAASLREDLLALFGFELNHLVEDRFRSLDSLMAHGSAPRRNVERDSLPTAQAISRRYERRTRD